MSRESSADSDLDRDRRFLGVYQKVSRLVSMSLDHQEVMETIVRSLTELLTVDACTIRLLDHSTRSFVLGAAHGVSLNYLSREVIDTEDTLTQVRSGTPVYSANAAEESCPQFRQAAAQEGIKSILTVPILYKEELIGIMRLLTRKTRQFTDAEIGLVVGLSEQIGVAISHGRMFKEMEDRLVFLNGIYEISTLVNSTLDIDHIFNVVVERAAVSLGAKGCTLRLINSESGLLELAASYGVSASYLHRGEVSHERNIQVVLNGEPVAIYDVRRDPRIEYHEQMTTEGICSLLAVPVKVNDEVIGALRILSDRPRIFTDSAIRFAVTLAEVGGAAIRKARSYQKITRLMRQVQGHEAFLASIIDSLQHQLLVIDPNRRVVLANRVYLEAIGKEEKEVLGRPYTELDSIAPEDSPVEQVLQGREMNPCLQTLGKDESQRWLEWTAFPIYDEGDLSYVIEIVRDVTSEHLLAEERLQSGKLQAILSLAGTVAHEVNSPLFAALGTAELLVEELRLPEEREELGVIIRNLKQIGELTGKMVSMTGFTDQKYVGERKILSF
ncbi:MAG: GAF domain-containing protein [Desulfobulbus sp.]|nr:GAF domain-containing protein [Desulfobulbus sp.]